MKTQQADLNDGRSKPRLATDQKIESAVREVIGSDGFGGVTIDRVSEVSGVARTTLYRRYRNRFELLEAVAEQIVSTIPPENEITLEGFTRVIDRLRQVFAADDMRKLVAHMFRADDEFLVTWRARFIGPRLAVLHDFLVCGVEAGTLVAEAGDGLVVELVLGAILVATTMHARLPDHWSDALAKRLWPTIAA
ncbi:TetR/AcrR family transcriptional regulator [Streptomyces sp. 8L]|uniref:TetR/AcrR family transcriptional regulator n=1 Tax=Streptomyces sp. 8L TaxID=2877242 RepID=UPI001CD678C7|nr:helix-turn-helix domain-containing protein [Streptomyces sp. 8L]MCA1224030.1 TetR/AcrR family transcriptional regulator [Streptomyces sp. 8L]